MTIQQNPEYKKWSPEKGINIQNDDEFWNDLMEKVEENRDIIPIEEVPVYEAQEIKPAAAQISKPRLKINWPDMKVRRDVAEIGWGVGSILGTGAGKLVYVCVQGFAFLFIMFGGLIVHLFTSLFSGEGVHTEQYDDAHLYRRRPRSEQTRQTKVNNITINNITNIQQ